MSDPLKKAGFAADKEAAQPNPKRGPGRPPGSLPSARREPLALELGLKVRRLRLEAGLSMEKLARAGKISTSYISRLENGHINPTVDVLGRLTGVFGLTIDTLLAMDAVAPSPDKALLRLEELDMEVKFRFYQLKGKPVSKYTKRILAVVIEEELKSRAAE